MRERRDERRVFEQAAEIFFARVLMLAVSELGVCRRLITDFEAFELHDANELLAALPDLALL